MQDNCFGIMLDMSRNAVMTVEQIKNYVDIIKKLGYNMLQLYTEDTYSVEGEPYFGYMRGRYSEAELKEVDEYCTKKGIELVPCIQTLGHLHQIFRWEEYNEVCDYKGVLLIDSDRTYQLIERMFASIRRCFSTDIIHIGMDEANFVGFGKYLALHGIKNRFEILKRHLDRIKEIAKKYGFKPIMWSDMFFRLLNNGDYYLNKDPDEERLKEVAKSVPDDIGLIYWDYYSLDEQRYKRMIDAHKALNGDVWFAGGAWSWLGFAPLNEHAINTMLPAIKACKERAINKIIFTIWGDDGAECSRYASLPALYRIKRFYDGQTDLGAVKKEFNELTGEDYDLMMALDMPNVTELDKLTEPLNAQKYLFYSDLFLGYADSSINPKSSEYFSNTIKILSKYPKNGKFFYVFDNLIKLCAVLEKKCDLGVRIRNAYKNKDKKALKKCVCDIGETIKRVRVFYQAFKTQWLKENKSFGFEIQDMRIGGLEKRLENCKCILKDYIKGKIARIDELEEELLPFPKKDSVEKRATLIDSWYKMISPNYTHHG